MSDFILEKSCALGLPYVLYGNFRASLDFEGSYLFHIVPVPDHCLFLISIQRKSGIR